MFSYKNYTIKSHWRESVLIILAVANIVVWAFVYQHKAGPLRVYFLDVGQGDAIFIETPSKKQVLIDGGKNRKVVTELGRIMSFGDKSIDIVIATHPDADHIGGLPEVVERYDVELFLESNVQEEKALNYELHERLEKKNIQILTARKGQIINFGDGARLAVLFPDRDVSDFDTNDASVVAKLIYGSQSFLFTGDAGIKTENTMIYHSKNFLNADVLKVGHHGSRTSTSLMFATAVQPLYAVISAGKDNTYGHPHKEVLNILEKVGAKIINTADSGTIKLETNGENLVLK